jgi:hypothetical protein
MLGNAPEGFYDYYQYDYNPRSPYHGGYGAPHATSPRYPHSPYYAYSSQQPSYYGPGYQEPVEENDEFSELPAEEYRPKSGVHTQLVVNKFDLGEIRFAWVSGSLNDDHTLAPAIYLSKVVNWSKIFVLLMGFFMDPSTSSLDIFSIAPANNHQAFAELVETLTKCKRVAFSNPAGCC